MVAGVRRVCQYHPPPRAAYRRRRWCA